MEVWKADQGTLFAPAMSSNERFTRLGFIKSYLLPALVLFLIPGFGSWFFNHVESSLDAKARDYMVMLIRADAKMSEEEKKEALEFYERIPVSRILASNRAETQELRDQFEPLKARYAVIRWMKRASAACILTGLAAFAAVGTSVWFSFKSQAAQYWSLRIGWNVLRWLALLQVVCQGALLIALSYWISAFWFEVYYVKLIAIAAVAALGAVWLLIKAIFAKMSLEHEFEGTRVAREQAPALWSKIEEMARKMGIAPPDHLFTGINDQFFVTEHPGKVGNQQWNGRILFASLALLRTLSKAEAEAVLAHELAHFSGEDTLYSKRISPLLVRFEQYLLALYLGGVSRPVFYFMFLFWNLYQISLGRISREREFRADKVGADSTSATDMAAALVKVTAYGKFRHQVQQTSFDGKNTSDSADLRRRIDTGFPDFATTSTQSGELATSNLPHPFDSHPTLAKRLENLGLNPDTAIKSPLHFPAPDETWYGAIEGAAQIEDDQWNAFEQQFQKQHDESLAWRYKPETDAEREHVIKYFPALSFQSLKDNKETLLEYHKIQAPAWEVPVDFDAIKTCQIDKSWGKNVLIIDCHPDTGGRKRQFKLNVKKIRGAEQFLEAFQKYYSRHLTARQLEADAAASGENAK